MPITTVDVIEATTPEEAGILAPLCDNDGGLYVGAVLSADSEKSDYGVPGSPTWEEVTNIVVDSYEINGVEYSPKQVKTRFGGDVAYALWEIAADVGYEAGDWT